MRYKTLIPLLAAGALAVSVAPSALAQEERLAEAAAVLEEIMQVPDKAIPEDLFGKAQCAVVVPGLKKGAFIVGARFGRGFIACRTATGWSAPGAVRVEGGSIGFQIGGQETDVVMLVMNKRGADRLLRSRFTLGAEGSVAAGPLGRQASALTDAQMHAEILAWSRARGIFAGVSLEGATLREDRDVNRILYGRAVSNREVVTGSLAPPASAAAFMAQLGKH